MTAETPQLDGAQPQDVATAAVPTASAGRRPKVAVICAAHRGNSGMYSVDSAAVAYFSGQDCEFELFTAQFDPRRPTTVAGREFRPLSTVADLGDYSHVVYWGDFLNNPVYGMWDFARRDRQLGLSVDRTEGYARWAELFSFRGGRPEARVVSVGNNFQHDFSEKIAQYRPALERMQQVFAAMLPRDTFSLQNLSRHYSFAALPKLRQGLDCAFLLPPMEVVKRPEFTYFFGRSGFSDVDRLVSAVEAATGLRGVPLDGWLNLSEVDAEAEFHVFRRQIAASRFALTDTYHLAINSFTLGVPVIGLGRAQVAQRGTLGDFKKRILFQMLDQEDLYREQTDETDDQFFDDIARGLSEDAVRRITDPERFALIAALTRKFRRDLDRAIFG